jgi:serine/threonine protein kinase
LRQLNHPNIAKIVDLVKHNKVPVIVMELCDGSLQDFLDQNKGKQILEKDIVYIFRQICGALEYIHEKGFVHRDLNPGNILFKKEGDRMVWKISDFGASVKNDSKLKTSVRQVMTTSYASIEQLQEKDPLPGYDVWSAGIILYELISGTLPYESKSAFTMLDLIRSNQRLPLPDTYSIHLRDLVDKMLTIDINQRISIKDMYL